MAIIVIRTIVIRLVWWSILANTIRKFWLEDKDKIDNENHYYQYYAITIL